MHKKALSLVLSGILSFTLLLTGCETDEAEDVQSQEQQVQQQEEVIDKSTQQEEQNEDTHKQDEEVQQKEQIVDEDLTEEYEEEANQTEQLEQGKLIIEQVSNENLSGFRWEVMTDEESNTVILKLNLTKDQVTAGMLDGSWNELVDICVENTTVGKETFEKLGLDINYSIWIGDIDADNYWLCVMNEYILFDVTDKLE